jgi:teichoic acid transport system ATP-binding protein
MVIMKDDSINRFRWSVTMKHSVVFNHVTKKYKMYHTSKDRLKGVVAPNRFGEDFYAVRDITFTADPGDVIGVVGVNGAGKSTLSNLIANVAPQTSGEIVVNGKAAIIAISSGLDSELTGRDNIEYKCLMLGFKKKEIQALIPEIIAFADIGNFIDQPVKSYSSGMKSRLGFAISVNVDPDVLVIDEALSVGDQTFKEKCYDKMNEFKEKGKTIFFVSHSIREVKKFCEKVLWLEAGEVKAYGTKKQVLPKYRAFLKEFKELSAQEKANFRQHVIEKRSRASEVHKREEPDQHLPRQASRMQRNKKKPFFLSPKVLLSTFLLLLVVLGATAYFVKPWEIFLADESEPKHVSTTDSAKKNPVQDAEKNPDEEKKDIRYVTVDSGSVRSAPNLNSDVIDFAGFGEAFEVKDTENDLSDDIEWLKIQGITTDREGWMSSKLLMEVDKELDDAVIAADIQTLIGSHPVLEEISQKDAKTGDDQSDVDIPVMDTGETELMDELDEPKLKIENKILYHGEKFDYMFKLENERVKELTIRAREDNDL